MEPQFRDGGQKNNNTQKYFGFFFKYHRNKKYKILLVIVFSFLVFIGIYTLLPINNSKNTSLDKIQKTTPPSPTPVTKKWKLQEKTLSRTKTLITFPEEKFINVAVWNTTLFFSNGRTIEWYNPQTKQQKTIVDESFLAAQEYDRGYDYYKPDFNNLHVIDNTLFISLGALPRVGYSYWIDLERMTPPQKLLKLQGSRSLIKKIDNQYLLFDYTYSDVCGNLVVVYGFNPKNKKLYRIETVGQGCIGTYNDLGIDRKKRLFLGGVRYNDPTPELASSSQGQVFTHIEAISLFYPYTRQTILSSTRMPQNTKSIMFSPDSNQLFLAGNTSLYRFSIHNNRLEKVMDFPQSWADTYLVSLDNNTLCTHYTDVDGKKSEHSFIDLTRKATTEDGHCDHSYQQSITYEDPLEKQFTFPANFQLIKE